MGGLMSSTINASTASGGGVITSADASGVLALQTGGTTAVTIDTSQNVGIGTASPSGAYKLQVTNGTVYTGVTSDGSNGILESNSALFVRTNTANPVVFGTGVGATERARIDASGNLLVGCTASPPSAGGFTLDKS